MTESKYEKYVVREPIRLQGFEQEEWSTTRGSMTAPPFSFLLGDKPIKDAHTMVEYTWVWKDTAIGATVSKPPHKHDYDEIFFFIGTDRENTNDLGADINFWMGWDKDAELIQLNTSSLVFVPRGLVHLPVIFKNVKKPFIFVIIALGLSEMSTVKYPLRIP